MRQIEERWGGGFFATDNYGLSELNGPGMSGECRERDGLHINEDHFLCEIIDAKSGETMAPGSTGELVVTNLTKQGAAHAALPHQGYHPDSLRALCLRPDYRPYAQDYRPHRRYAEDPRGQRVPHPGDSSQNEQDSRHYAVSAKLPMLEPADSEEARAFAKRAFQLSEEYDTPVFLKLCTRIAHSQSIVELGEREEVPAKPYEKNIAKYVMVPGNARPRHPIVEERTQRLTAYAETTDLNREELGTDRTLGIITSSTCYQYAREVFGPQASILKLGLVNPLPREKILAFAAKVDQVLVLEELDPVIETHCRNLGLTVLGKDRLPMVGEFSQGLVAQRIRDTARPWMELEENIPPRPPVLCAGCPHRGLFYTLAKHKVTVLGDHRAG